MEYPKIENLWVRDPETHIMASENGYRQESFSQVNKWLVLEKIDGMNMRVVWEPYEEFAPRIYGRSDAAMIPGDLLVKMQSYFTTETLTQVFGVDEEGEPLYSKHPSSVVLFGEGYGAGIQKGGHYREDKDFRLFDVVVNGTWLRWSDVQDVARKFGIETVPVLGHGYHTKGVESVVSLLRKGFTDQLHVGSFITDTPEGVIARTDPYLFDGRGKRVMFKHKVRDVAA